MSRRRTVSSGNLSPSTAEELALRLDQAEQTRTPIAPLSESYPGLTVADAYTIQQHWLQKKFLRGARLVGHKVGLTSLAMQRQMGVDQPDYGFLLDSMVHSSGALLPLQQLIQPRVEPEIAFWLQADLSGPHVTPAEVLAATQSVSAALEIVDSRISDWRIKLTDTIADNASSARVVVGRPIALHDLDLETEQVELRRNGEVVGTGNGAAVLGHPAAAIAWLVRKLAEFNTGLRAGELVLPGAMCAAVPAQPGDRFVARFSHLGEVKVSFG
ncbi:hypothetical protein A4R35_01260 [Thermogemmatispora tikiterensis]|uniref:Fumarylacetoacetase-like C-terminal domain-containing protein n=1 Tax=Thermogemmatispora tikiterensis TaxID=1825093 RepID=A0A328VBL4_9CHLR|nr:hypothetical protein A4R35_01260 [Thermogemmatispora tikiterensis]